MYAATLYTVDVPQGGSPPARGAWAEISARYLPPMGIKTAAFDFSKATASRWTRGKFSGVRQLFLLPPCGRTHENVEC